MWNFKTGAFFHDLKKHVEQPPVPRKGCDVPGCEALGEYRAPKSRQELKSYYWFCMDHVREYNANWDFFKGMSRGEIEHHMNKTAVWDRPTWRSTEAGLFEQQQARRKIYEHFTGEGVAGDFSMRGEDEGEAHINVSSLPHPTVEALAVMDLAPPVQWDEVKARYKTLAKRYHPDTNQGDKAAEEQFKKITLAYTIIKLSYENYTKLDEK
jgi:hypothetical protein